MDYNMLNARTDNCTLNDILFFAGFHDLIMRGCVALVTLAVGRRQIPV